MKLPGLAAGRRPKMPSFQRLRGSNPLELHIVGRTLWHAALVGLAAGFVGTVFVAALDLVQRVVLEDLVGYSPLRAAGEEVLPSADTPAFRWWLLLFLPGLGALISGIVSGRLAPETQGGGADAIIRAFHEQGGLVRRRVAWVKAVASIFTLGFGGSGGREGPTMQIGGALGSLCAQWLRVSERERRVLLVAGTGAGMAAVFRTPLGAALLAVEILHRDDFESDALVPAVLASVVGYSVFISFFGETTLFAHTAHYPFIPAQLPLYALMAVVICFGAVAFLDALDAVKKFTARLPWPVWAKPALGGLLLGVLATPILLFFGPRIGHGGEGLGILGGGYGLAQVAITGAPWFHEGWTAVALLLLLGGIKIVATALTVGTGGSAGDFGPSLVVGALFGGAFGRAAELLLNIPDVAKVLINVFGPSVVHIDPGAFALVGMGVFYGGLAHVPIASLVMVCELAGSYDLLVPLMFAEGIAFVALRKRSMYHAQVPTRRDSPAHRDELLFDALKGMRVGDVVVRDRPFASFLRATPSRTVLDTVATHGDQEIFPVLDENGGLVGTIGIDIIRTLARDPELGAFTVADDLMTQPVAVGENDDLHSALEALLAHGSREVIVVDDTGKIIGLLDETEITAVYSASAKASTSSSSLYTPAPIPAPKLPIVIKAKH